MQLNKAFAQNQKNYPTEKHGAVYYLVYNYLNRVSNSFCNRGSRFPFPAAATEVFRLSRLLILFSQKLFVIRCIVV
jgi:hypothetical protein